MFDIIFCGGLLEGSQLSEKIGQLKMKAEDGKNVKIIEKIK
jgi:hypothetical protein